MNNDKLINEVNKISGITEQLETNVNEMAFFKEQLYDGLFQPPLASSEWQTDSSGMKMNMTSNEFLDLFYNCYLGEYTDYTVTRNVLGKEQSGQYDLYEYVFEPKNYTKTILLSSGMHSWELPASFGLAHFIKHLMTFPYIHDGFKHLKENVRIKVIPMINPWGFDQPQKTYGNYRGVNINRNFDSNGKWSEFTEGDIYNKKGDAPFSEAETKILKNWVDINSTSEFWIDCHTGMNNVAVDNWLYYFTIDNKKDKILTALEKLNGRINIKYNKTPNNNLQINNVGLIRGWYCIEQLGLSTITLELANTNWGNGINNNQHSITEYEVALCSYIFEYLGIKTKPLKEAINNVEYLELTKNEILKVNNKLDVELLKMQGVSLLDRFNRQPSIYLRNAETGQSWTNPNFSITSGTVSSNGTGIALIDGGLTEYSFISNFTWSNYSGLVFRYKDSANYFTVRINSTGINIHKTMNGRMTVLGEYLFTPTTNKIYKVEIINKKNVIELYLDDIKVITTYDVDLMNNTIVGLRTNADSLAKFYDVLVRKIKCDNPFTKDLTLYNGWNGTLTFNKNESGLVSLCGNLTVGDKGDSTYIAYIPTGSFPKTGHVIMYQDMTSYTSNLGFYVSATNGQLYLRNPGKDILNTGDTISFNTVYQS